MDTHRLLAAGRLGLVCSLLASCLAAIVLWSWIAGVGELFSLTPRCVPVAPSTGLAVGLAAGALLLLHRWPGRMLAMRLAYGVAGLVAMIGAAAYCRRPWDVLGAMEHWLVFPDEPLDVAPMSQMSPWTGAVLLVLALAIVLRLWSAQHGGLRWRSASRWSSVGLAVAMLLVGIGTCVSSLWEQQATYGPATVSMPIGTAIALSLLSLGVLGTHVIASPQTAPGGSFLAGSMSVPPEVPEGHREMLVARLLAVLIGLLSAVYLRYEQTERRAEARHLLQAVGDLKVGQVSNWREERLGDATFFSKASFVARDVQALLADRSSAAARGALQHWLTLLKGERRYSEVTLLDAEGTALLTVAEQPETSGSLDTDLATEALRSRKVVMSDLHHDRLTGEIRIDMVFAVFPPAVMEREPAPAALQPALGYVLLRLDPRRFLYPLIQSWPTPSRTAETLLMRREGDEVVYLNELRHQSNTALLLRRPIESDIPYPAEMGACGTIDLVAGRDYRGVPVLADLSAIQGTPWFLVAKIDRDELYAPLRERAAWTLAVTIALAVAMGLGGRLLGKHRETTQAQLELAAERQHRALAQRVEHLMKSAGDIIILSDERWRILDANDRAVESYGYSSAELRRMQSSELRAPDAAVENALGAEQLAACGQAVFESVHRRKDGSCFPVEVNLRVVEIDRVRYQLAIIRDIAQRKSYEREIVRLNRLYIVLSQVNQAIVRARARDEMLQAICQVAVNFGGFLLSWVGRHDPATAAVTPVAQAGPAQSILQHLAVFADDRPEGECPAGSAIRERRFRVGIVAQAPASPWRDAAAERGLAACVSFPLYCSGAVWGVVTLGSDEADFFNDEELRLLEEISMDISYALEHFQDEERRRQAESALRESEAKFRSYIQQSPVAVFVANERGQLVDFNPAGVKLSGYSAATLGSLSVFEVLPEEHRPAAMRDFAKLVAEGHCEGEYWPRRGDGQRIWISLRAVRTAEGRYMAFCQDITERRVAEQALRENQAQLETILEHLNEGLVVACLDGRLFRWNRAAVEMHGFESLDQCLRHLPEFAEIFELSTPDGLLLPLEQWPLARILRGERLADLEIRIRRRDSNWRRVFNYGGELVRDPEGRPLMAVVSIADVTQRRRTEESLIQSQAILQSFYDSSTFMMGVVELTEEDFVVVHCNNAVARFIDSTPERMAHRTGTQIGMPPELIRRWIENCQRCLGDGGPARFEYEHVVASGPHWLAATVAWLGESNRRRPRFSFVIEDITHHRRAEAEREITVRLLQIFNDENDLPALMQAVTSLLQEWVGCEAVGIRLRDGDDYPYFVTRGLPPQFEEAERWLCQRNGGGQLLRDGTGNPVLACMCGAVLRGQFDPEKPFFTGRGSFWTNSTTQLLASTGEADRSGNARNRCNQEGYESVALIALRVGQTTHGLLQISDRREQCFTPERISLLERLADSLAIAVAHRQGEELVRRSEERYRLLAENADGFVSLNHADGRRLYVSPSYFRVTGWTMEEIQSTDWRTRVHPDDIAKVRGTREANLRGETTLLEHRSLCKDGRWLWLESRCRPVIGPDGQVQQLVLWSRDITDRKAAEEALRDNETQYRTVIETSADGYWMTDMEGRILEVNDAYVRRSGYSRDELTRMRISDLEAQERPTETSTHIETIVREGSDLFETWHRTKSGTIWPVEASVSYSAISGGRFFAFLRDVHRRNRLEALQRTRLRLSERALHGTIDELAQAALDEAEAYTGSSIGFFHFIDADQENLTLQAWSTNTLRSACQAEGRGLHYPISQAGVWVDAFHARKPVVHNDYSALLHQRGMPDGHAAVTRELAVPVLVNNLVLAILGVGNKPSEYTDEDVEAVQQVATMAMDLVSRKRVEEALRATEERFQAVVESSPDGIFIQIDGTFAYVNAPTVRLFGAKVPEDLLGQPVLQRFHPDSHPLIRQRIRQVNELRQPVGLAEEPCLRLDGSAFQAEVIGVPFHYAGKDGGLVFFRDITDRKRLEEDLRQAHKMEAIGQLAGGVAHDFNNILTAIMIQLGMLQAASHLDPATRKSLVELESEASRAASLTRQLLLFGRRSMMRIQTVDLNGVVENLLMMLRRLIGEHISLNWQGQPGLPPVMADVGMVEQVIINLAVNARDVMPKGGSLTISTEAVLIDAQQAQATPEAYPGLFVCLAVADTGCGIEPEMLQHIFEPFFTTKAVGKGTGLGLASVYGIVKQHQGWIGVDTELGQGSTFRVYLPAAAGQCDQPAPSPAPAEGPSGGGSETILLVEDEPSVRQMIAMFLEEWGYRILEAVDGVEAQAVWQTHQEQIDLLFTDMVMPRGLTGLELADALRRVKPGLKVIVSSGYSAELVNQGDALPPGISFLAKPCPPAEMLAAVRRCLDEP